ncbi:MAG TPA: efflux RND transporter periplasmic adaptor subunit [Leptolyngbyaceae cyanobacterium]
MDSGSQADPSPPDSLSVSEGASTPNAVPIEPLADIFSEAEEKQRTGVKWILGSGLLVIAAFVGWWGYTTRLQKPAEPLAVITAPVQKETLRNSITASGTVELGGQQTLKSPGEVTVEQVLVQERQRVKAGQVLLVLRDRTLQNQLEEQLIQNQIDALGLARSREVVQEEQADLQAAEEQLAESASLLERGFIAEDQYKTDQNAMKEAQNSLRDAQVKLQQDELQRQRNEAKVANLKAQLADNQIRAPFDAFILTVDVQPGAGVEVEKPLLTLGDPNQETIQLQLTTLDANKVKPNMPVQVSVIGPNSERYEGRVLWVSPQAVAEESGRGVGSGQAKVAAAAVLNRPSRTLIPGSSVSVDIILAQRQDVIVVPLSALQQESDRTFVWVKDAAGTAQKRPVVVGLQTLEAAEIVSGLALGDEIIVSLPPEVELMPGIPLQSPSSQAPEQ